MAFTKVSVLKSSDNAGRPVSFKDKIVLIEVDDIASFPARDTNGILISSNITLKAGKTAIQMYSIPKTLKAYNAPEGDPDKKGYIQHLEFEHPGDELKYNEFAENCINKNFIAIIGKFDGTGKRVLGTPGCPLQFSDEGKNDSEAVTNTVKFESLIRGPRIAHYSGTLPTLDSGSAW